MTKFDYFFSINIRFSKKISRKKTMRKGDFMGLLGRDDSIFFIIRSLYIINSTLVRLRRDIELIRVKRDVELIKTRGDIELKN